MANHNGQSQSPILLQSRDHSELLDIIDLLRSQGVSNYVPLPQLIVCGDQSSGKSSVLEAVSGVRFPTKDTLCTRFATELILRKGSEVKVTVGITPGENRSDDKRAELSKFRVKDARIEDFPSLVEDAKVAMGLDSNTRAFSSDVLRVEVTGPTQSNLTLVDLPGLIHAENKQQSAEDVSLVASLVTSYMAQSRSIILAVVSAKNDLANQIVTKLARDVDPKGIRTLGIITKPDTLNVGSESERDFFELAKNEDVHFRLGWHVLRNRDYANRDCSTEERDNDERFFFSKGIWTSLPLNVVGLDSLKPRLSTVLRDQIISELPSLVRDVEGGIEDCRNRLAKLGDARATLSEQRRHLLNVGQAFGYLAKAAVGGAYADDFFGPAITKEGHSKRLRAVVQSLLIDFADDVRRKGHDREIVDEAFADTDGDNTKPPKVAREVYISEVRTLMRQSRGCELPSTFNPMIIGDLFFQQSRPWKNIVHSHCQKVLDATRLCIHLTLIHLADDQTRSGLHREVIEPALEGFSRTLEQKISELMRPHQKGHPITYNYYFIETVQKARENHEKKEAQRRLNEFFSLNPNTQAAQIHHRDFNTRDLLQVLTTKTEQDMELYACSEVTDCMQAYYEVAMKVMVDNVAVLGIEFSLLERLSGLLSSDVVMNLDHSVVEEIAAEKEDSRLERARALSKLQTLEAALHTVRHYGRHKLEVPDFNVGSEVNGDERGVENTGMTADESRAVGKPSEWATAFGFAEEISHSPEAREPLSPFDSGGSIRSDRSWQSKRLSAAKKKKITDPSE